jgi:hypothetical protein
MSKPRLHLDADASRKDLRAALVSKGHDISRTPASGLPVDASDEFQLLWASAHDRVLFTFNIGDFLQLARRIPEHRGIFLASQQSHFLRELIAFLDRALTGIEAENWVFEIGWLPNWKLGFHSLQLSAGLALWCAWATSMSAIWA